MKNNQYTPLPLSKLIAERLPELETEMIRDSRGVITIRGGANWDMNLCSPTYSFTDCLRAIEMLGEKEGWEKMQHFTRMLAYGEGEEYWFGTDNKEPEPMWKAEAFWLFENYLSDHYTIGENTIAYLTELFTKK